MIIKCLIFHFIFISLKSRNCPYLTRKQTICVSTIELAKNKGCNSSYSPHLCRLILLWGFTQPAGHCTFQEKNGKNKEIAEEYFTYQNGRRSSRSWIPQTKMQEHVSFVDCQILKVLYPEGKGLKDLLSIIQDTLCMSFETRVIFYIEDWPLTHRFWGWLLFCLQSLKYYRLSQL